MSEGIINFVYLNPTTGGSTRIQGEPLGVVHNESGNLTFLVYVQNTKANDVRIVPAGSTMLDREKFVDCVLIYNTPYAVLSRSI